jgi:hypothetical protein
MTGRLIIGIFLALLLAPAGGCRSSNPAPQVASDLTTPKAAALTFLHAISAGDVKTAKSASIGNDQEKAAVEALATLVTGLRDYERAITKHFGGQAAQSSTQLRMAITDLIDVSIGHAENGIVNQGPETASVEPAVGGVRLRARSPIYLRKEKDRWKVDLATTSRADKRFDPAIAEQYLAAGKALHEAAKRVNAGRYKTFADAQRDADSIMP